MRKPLHCTALLCLRSERFLPRFCLGFYMPFFHGKGMQFLKKTQFLWPHLELKYAHLANICQDLRRLAAHLRAEPITFFLLFLMIFCQDMQVLAADFVRALPPFKGISMPSCSHSLEESSSSFFSLLHHDS